MKLLLAAILLVSTPAGAQMSPVGCNALSASADTAAAKVDEVIKSLSGDVFRNAIPYMPEKAKSPAADVADARVSAQFALVEYAKSLKDFSAKIRNCGD
ncbi:hypothetical protein [Mesorhizobium sp. 128a]